MCTLLHGRAHLDPESGESGKLIGIITAISVGSTEFGIDVLEDIMIVIPLYKIEWDML